MGRSLGRDSGLMGEGPSSVAGGPDHPLLQANRTVSLGGTAWLGASPQGSYESCEVAPDSPS